MTVLNFSYATIKNAEKFQQYLAARSKTTAYCERAGFGHIFTLISLNRPAIRLNQRENLPQTSTLSRRHLSLNGLLEAAAALMEGADVEVIVRGEFSKTMAGDHTAPHIVAVFRYADMAAAENIYTSAQYKALIPLRDEACDMTINLYEE